MSTPRIHRFDLPVDQRRQLADADPKGDKLTLMFGRAGHGRQALGLMDDWSAMEAAFEACGIIAAAKRERANAKRRRTLAAKKEAAGKGGGS